jgi:hypothetical protein
MALNTSKFSNWSKKLPKKHMKQYLFYITYTKSLVVKSQFDLITLTPNLIECCSTIRFLLWDASISKHRIWQNVQNLFKLYHSHHVWYHDILTNLMIFRLHLHFLEFKTNLVRTSWSCLLNKTCKISFDLRSDLKID